MTSKFSKCFALVALILLNCNIAYPQVLGVSVAPVSTTAAPASITNVYSDIDMRVRLASKANEKGCGGEQCVLNSEFDTQVQQLGEQLAATAYATYPELRKKSPPLCLA